MSLLCFPIARAHKLDAIIVCYVGYNQNVVTWSRRGRPGNRVAKYFARILNGLGNEYGFTLAPMYISPLNNKLQDELPRLNHREAAAHGIASGLQYVDVAEIAKAYFERRLHDFSVILPTDNPERVRAIMQFVEKRIVRFIPVGVMESTHVYALGLGTHGWGLYKKHPRLHRAKVAAIQ